MSLNPKEIDLLERVVSKIELQPIFFKKVKGLKWFDPLKDCGFFNPSKNPPPVKQERYIQVPTWPVTEYLAVTAPELLIEGNEAYAGKFFDLLKECTDYSIEHEYSNYRTWWQFSKIIRYIPVNLISLNDLSIIKHWLADPYERSLVADEMGENWLPKLLDNTDEHSHHLALKLIDLLFKIDIVQFDKIHVYKEAQMLVKEWYAKKIAAKIINKAGTVLKQGVVDTFKVKTEDVLRELDKDAWSYVWRTAIEDHDNNNKNDDAVDVIIEAFRDSLLSWIAIEPEIAKQYVAKLLVSEFQTLKRIAIYVTNEKFNLLSGLIDNIIVDVNFNNNLRHELWHLLNGHFNDFSVVQQQKVIQIINSLMELDEDKNVIEGSTAYQQSVWLSALKEHSSEILMTYNELISKAGSEPEHPDCASYISVGWVRYKSPISREVILSLGIEKLVQELDAFEAKGGFNEPDINGLAKEFKSSVKSEPLKFHSHLRKFLNTKHAYIHSLIASYRELWIEKTQLPWDDIWRNLLSFCKLIVEDSNFKADKNNNKENIDYADFNSLISEIGKLIEVGTKSDDHAFDASMLESAQEILVIILNNQKGRSFEVSSDAVSIAINSARGQCIEALINLTLRSCRLQDQLTKRHEEAWEKFKPLFDAELKKVNEGAYEFATLVTQYLPNFMYISKDWVISNLNEIFNDRDYLGWLCAMQGYVYSDVYKEIYQFLASNGHLLKALDDQNIRERLNEALVQQIIIAYLNDYESLEEPSSMIAKLLARKNTSELSQLIWFLGVQSKGSDAQLNNKIFELWPKLINIIDVASSDGKKLASKLCSWVVFINEITNQNRNLLIDIVPYVDVDHNTYIMMENLARLSENQPEETFQIWMKILDRDTPEYPPEAIKTLLLNINKSGSEGIRNAKAIASKYIAVGNDQLSQWLKSLDDVV